MCREYISIFPFAAKSAYIIAEKNNALLFIYFFYANHVLYFDSLLRMEAQTWKRLLNTQTKYDIQAIQKSKSLCCLNDYY